MFDDAPFTVLPAHGASPLFVFCDHATNHIPTHLQNLGLTDADLQRHIAWDIGAESLTRHFCSTFGAAGLLAGFSRLVIDPNRALDSPTLIPEISDGTPIPGNENLSEPLRRARIEGLYKPYHQALERSLDEAQERYIDPLIVSIHSFTPQLYDQPKRGFDIGLLWKVDKDLAHNVKAEIESVHPYRIALNQPYSAMELNFSMDRHVIPRGLRHVTFEVCQDLIDTETGATQMANRLTAAIRHFVRP